LPVAVELRDVSFAYDGGRPVLEHVNLAVEAGEFVAIAGPNGGGKTTLMRLALGLERPGSGEASLFGEPAARFSGRSALGYLAQRSQLGVDAPATVREVVAAGRLASGGLLGPLRRRDRAIVAESIERVGLGDSADLPLRTLSGGQQQRAFIAKALAGQPSLLVLDEPTTGVDAESPDCSTASTASSQSPFSTSRTSSERSSASSSGSSSSAAALSSTGRRRRSRASGTTHPTSMLDLEFMRLAFAAGAIVGLLAPAVGFFLVQRQLSLIGDGIGHVAFAGVAAGYLLGLPPVLTALVASIGGAGAIEWLRARKNTAGDQALALVFYTGIAAGVVLISMAGALNVNLFGFLFGSILTTTRTDLAVVAALGIAGLGTIALLYRALAGVALDEEGARVAGVPVAFLNVVLAVLAATTVAVSMRIVGILLIAALMVLPVIAATRIARSMRSTLLLGMAIGLGSVLGGLTVSYYADLPPGGTIVLIAAATFLATSAFSALRLRT
jgi:zinc transport system permease protein